MPPPPIPARAISWPMLLTAVPGSEPGRTWLMPAAASSSSSSISSSISSSSMSSSSSSSASISSPSSSSSSSASLEGPAAELNPADAAPLPPGLSPPLSQLDGAPPPMPAQLRMEKAAAERAAADLLTLAPSPALALAFPPPAAAAADAPFAPEGAPL